MSRSIFRFLIAVVLGAAVLLQHGCVEDFGGTLHPNAPPRTFFWLFPDSTIATGVSRVHLHWWGEDRDGYCIGYLLSFGQGVGALASSDTLTYVYTTATDSTMLLPIRQSFQNFLLVARAVDNTFQGGLVPGALVRLTPLAYWDVNANGTFDAGDVAMPTLRAAMDPLGAKQVFPVKNTPPSVESVIDPDDPSRIIQPPDTTYTVITFVWRGSDPDGDETLASYRIALNDTSSPSSWLSVTSSVTMITLKVPRSLSDVSAGEVTADVYGGVYPSLQRLGTIAGLKLDATNKLYIQARDVAGDYSPPLVFPTSTKSWFVKRPKSRLLVIADYQKNDSTAMRGFYRDRIAGVAGGAVANFDEFDIRSGSLLGSGKPGILVPSLSIVNPMFVETLKLYDYVFWYTDVYPSLTLAQYSLFYYSTSGGKVIFTTEFQSTSDPGGALRDFAPIDSVSSVILPASSLPSLGDSRIPKNYLANPDSSVGDYFPPLNVDSVTISGAPIASFVNVFMRPVYKRADARVLYRFQADTRIPTRYLGTPAIGVMRNDRNFVFFGFPIHYLNGVANGGQGVTALFNKIFVDEFGLRP